MTNFGVLMFPTDYAIQPVELAVAAEERGYVGERYGQRHNHVLTRSVRLISSRAIRFATTSLLCAALLLVGNCGTLFHSEFRA